VPPGAPPSSDPLKSLASLNTESPRWGAALGLLVPLLPWAAPAGDLGGREPLAEESLPGVRFRKDMAAPVAGHMWIESRNDPSGG
jgi:hypothetical protein